MLETVTMLEILEIFQVLHTRSPVPVPVFTASLDNFLSLQMKSRMMISVGGPWFAAATIAVQSTPLKH